jgi:hypothetical protein
MTTNNQHTRTLLTIVTEAAIEPLLTKDLEDLNTTGYTISNARGRGSRGVRNAGWETSGNIRIEIVCEASMATEISHYVKDKYYNNYAMIMFMTQVEVLRPEKF